MNNLNYFSRKCDCCQNDDLEEMWKYSNEYRTRSGVYKWKIRNVICKKCGFAFVSPAPTENALNSYYRDSFITYSGQNLDYSIEKRLKLIRNYQKNIQAQSFLEIGSNNSPEFISEVSNTFTRFSTVEINSDCSADYSSLNDISNESVDIIGSYFVLEHIPTPKKFLLQVASKLKINGIAIIEIPNLYLYPKDPAGLLLHEHLNHFSPLTFSNIAQLAGLEILEFSQNLCSRNFGFVAICQKKKKNIKKIEYINNTEYLIAKTCMHEGYEVIESFFKRINETRKIIDKIGKNIVIWGANAICAFLLNNYDLPQSSIIVDSDPKKKEYLIDHLTYQPINTLKRIEDAELLIINTRRNADDIKKWVADHTKNTMNNMRVIVLDYLPN